MNFKIKSVLLLLVTIALLTTMSTVAFATDYGWWNNTIHVGTGTSIFSGHYTMATSKVGVQGHFDCNYSGNEENFSIRPTYWDSNGDCLNLSLHKFIVKTSNTRIYTTWTEEDSGCETYFTLSVKSWTAPVDSIDTGYFYQQ